MIKRYIKIYNIKNLKERKKEKKQKPFVCAMPILPHTKKKSKIKHNYNFKKWVDEFSDYPLFKSQK